MLYVIVTNLIKMDVVYTYTTYEKALEVANSMIEKGMGRLYIVTLDVRKVNRVEKV